MIYPTINRAYQQHGSILLVSLVLLGIISIYGLSSMRGALTEQKIALNIQDRHLAIEGAESALREGERKINSVPERSETQYYDILNHETAANLVGWTDADSYKVPDGTGDIWDGAETPAPRYKLEQFAAPGADLETANGETIDQEQVAAITYHRILGYGKGKSATASAIVESIIIRR